MLSVSLLLRIPEEEGTGNSWKLWRRRLKAKQDSTLGGVLPRQHNGEESTCDAGDARDVGSIPGLGRPPEVGNGILLQYSCLGKSHRQRSLAVYGVTESQTGLSD